MGTTQALVSVDALQEFHVEGSTYSAEYGRNPGGQFALLTRSGTNDWHSTAFDYFRNDVFDANDWFNDNTVSPTSNPPERQNDFGGILGGPIRIPYLYNGKNRSFFFISYEGLRLAQPASATINAAPDIALRQSVTGSMQQVLNAFPLPTPNMQDLGGGLGEFIGSWSDPSQVDATSIDYGYGFSYTPNYPVYTNFSTFIQDAWKRYHYRAKDPPSIDRSFRVPDNLTSGSPTVQLSLSKIAQPLWRRNLIILTGARTNGDSSNARS